MSTQVSEIERRIREQIKRATPSQRLYNAGNEFVEQKVGGMIYVIPPDGYAVPPGETEQQKFDGILEVKDQWGFSLENIPPTMRREALRKAGKNPKPNKVILTALEVVQHLMKKLEPRGVVFLTGDPAEDAKLKEEARTKWTTFQLAQANRIISNYNNRTLAWHQDPRNAGKLPPSMTERESLAQEVIDAYNAGQLNKYKFVCPERDGYGTNDEAKFMTHMQVAHPASMQRLEDEVRNEPVKRGPGRPRKVQPEA